MFLSLFLINRKSYGHVPLSTGLSVLWTLAKSTVSYPYVAVVVIFAQLEVVPQVSCQRRTACVPEVWPEHTSL